MTSVECRVERQTGISLREMVGDLLRHEPPTTGHLVGNTGDRGDVRFDGTAGLLNAALQVLDRDDAPLFVDHDYGHGDFDDLVILRVEARGFKIQHGNRHGGRPRIDGCLPVG